MAGDLSRAITALAALGKGAHAIARACNCSVSLVRDHLAQAPAAPSLETVVRAEYGRADGRSSDAIAEQFGVTAGRVRNLASRLGIQRHPDYVAALNRSRATYVSPAGALVAAEWGKPDGMQTAALARQLGLSETQVRKMAHRIGLQRHPDFKPEGKGRPRRVPQDAESAAAIDPVEADGEEDAAPPPSHGGPVAHGWPADAPLFTDVDRLALLRETVRPNFRYLPSRSLLASPTGSSLGGF